MFPGYPRPCYPSNARYCLAGKYFAGEVSILWMHALQLKPAYACHRIRADRKVVKHRFATIGKSAISVAEHQPVSDGIQRVRYAQLGHWGQALLCLSFTGQSTVKSAAGILARSVKVELSGSFQSTWKAHTFTRVPALMLQAVAEHSAALPLGLDSPFPQLAICNCHEKVWSTGWGRNHSVQVGR